MTKLHIPQARTNLILRPRVLQQLTTLLSPGCKVGLISAPAGFGKTTLVVQWLADHQGLLAGWVSLDQSDNQPAAFFNYFISALQTTCPQVGKDALELLPLPGVNFDEIVTLVLNDLTGVTSPLVIILDDFHNITNPLIIKSLELFIDGLPAGMRLLLLTREDPALKLALRRANGQLVEIRQENLRFQLSEAIAFLDQGMGLKLVQGQIEILEERTEGWIAGLQLAALSLQHSRDVDRFIREFSGSNRFILDYLMEEVLAQQPREIQDFLFETSILEPLCAGLCAAVTQKTNGACQALLERLVRANLFVIALDEEGGWYRYHHMFRDLLLARFRAESPEQMRERCRRASEWYHQNGELRLAVEFALRAQDASLAADLLEMHFGERWQSSDLDFLFLIDRLPFEAIENRPSLCLDSAGLWITTGQYTRMLPFLDAAERCLANPARSPQPADFANRAFAQSLRAFLADVQDRPLEIEPTFWQGILAVPEEYPATRQSVAMLSEAVCYMAGDFAGVMHCCHDVLERDRRLNGTVGVALSVMRMVWVLQAQGKLHEALELVMEYEDYVRRRGSRRFYVSGILNLLWGDLLFEWNRLDEAREQIQQGLRLMEDWPVAQYVSLGLSLLARLQITEADLRGARATLLKAEELYREGEFHPGFLHALQKAQVRVWIAEHDLPALEAFARKLAPLQEQPLAFRIEAPLIELSRAWMALNRSEEACALLSRLASSAADRNGRRLEILTLLSVAEKNRPSASQHMLEQALRLGEPQGYLRTFLDGGEAVCQGLDLWLGHPPVDIPSAVRAYARRLHAAFGSSTQASSARDMEATSFAEPLTPREREVLQLLVEGCSNKRIAETLFLSEGTVKYYVHVILQKLGVQSRTQAIARARELELS